MEEHKQRRYMIADEGGGHDDDAPSKEPTKAEAHEECPLKERETQDDDMDETEDEEVKRNCYGMKFYTTSSCSTSVTSRDVSSNDEEEDEETWTQEHSNHEDDCSTISSCSTESELSSDGDETSSSKPQPTKFTFDLSKCGPGINIFRPKPVTLDKLKGYNRDNGLSPSSRQPWSLRSKSEDDDDDTTAAPESVQDDEEDVNEDMSDCSTISCPSEDEKDEAEVSRCDSFDDSSTVTLTSSKVASPDHFSSHDCDGDASISDNDDENEESEDEDEELMSDEDEEPSEKVAMADEEESSTLAIVDDNDGDDNASNLSIVAEDGIEQDIPEEKEEDVADVTSQQDASFEDDNNNREVEVHWDVDSNDPEGDDEIHYVNATAVSGSGSATCDESSISAEDLESIMEKVKDDDEEMSFTLDTTNQEREEESGSDGDDNSEVAVVVLSRKRSREDVGTELSQDHEVIRKRTCTKSLSGEVLSTNQTPFLPSLTNGPSSDITKFELFRRSSPDDLSSCYDDSDEVDTQLAEELLGCVSPTSVEGNANSNPIPLLTPPASPLPIKSDESVVEIYEWPSNLAVDNALTAAIQLRPLSPSSLAKLEEDEHHVEPLVTTLFPRKVRSVTRDFLNSPSLLGDA